MYIGYDVVGIIILVRIRGKYLHSVSNGHDVEEYIRRRLDRLLDFLKTASSPPPPAPNLLQES